MRKNMLLLVCTIAVLEFFCEAAVVESLITSGLFEPRGIAVATDEKVYIADSGKHRILKYNPSTGEISTFAGFAGVSGTNDGVGAAARFFGPCGIIVARGGLVVSDTYNHTIRFVSFNGTVTTLAGSAETPGFVDANGIGARFRFPQGLAADTAGNIYVADSKNNAIRKIDLLNNVTTLATGFNYPAAVSFDGTNSLWLADKLSHQIKLVDIISGSVTVVAGIQGQSGAEDHLYASSARFSSPQGLLWLGNNVGLMVADSENHLVRRVYYNSAVSGYSVETFVGLAGVAGRTDGSNSVATLNTPIGLAFDSQSGGFYIVDSKGPQDSPGALRRVQLFEPPPQISTPQIGRVIFVETEYGLLTKLEPVDALTFNNDITLAIKAETGVETYYTYGPTPTNQFEPDPIPDPSPDNSSSIIAPYYQDGMDSAPPSLEKGKYPMLTIKAMSVAYGRKPSSIAKVRLIFKASRPTIDSENAAGFTIYSETANSVIAYTIDGSDPDPNSTNTFKVSNNSIIRLHIVSNVVFKARALKDGFLPSEILTKTLSVTNSNYTKISFGYNAAIGEEASSMFIASPGQIFNVPITLTLPPAPSPLQTMYSLQFGVLITNLSPSLPIPQLGLVSMLKKPLEGFENTYVTIPPAFYYNSDLTNTVITNNISGSGFIGALWMERAGKTNLFDSKKQDLITYSMAHDHLYLSSGRKVIVGSLLVFIPPGVPAGSKYQIQIIRPSATADGIGEDVYIETPTNGSLGAGSINAIKEITIGDIEYLVGDVAPFRWFNGGDFGDGYLLNNDVVQVFQTAAYGLNAPPNGSDMFDAMDSCCIATNGAYVASTALFDGGDTSINTIGLGDGVLDIYDIFVTYRRSIDPSLVWYKRYFTPAGRTWSTVGVTNISRHSYSQNQAPLVNVKPLQDIAFYADDVIGAAGTIAEIPITVEINGDQPLKIFLLNLSVEPLDGSPALTEPIQFIPSQQLGEPSLTESKGNWNYAVLFMNNNVEGIKGRGVIGKLRVKIPQNAAANSAYAVNFMSVSAGGFVVRDKVTGLVSTQNRSASSFNDQIPDVWRLKYFGTVNNLLSQADADADGDGVPNIIEYRTGTNPTDPASRFQIQSEKSNSESRQVTLRWKGLQGKRYILEYANSLYSTNWQTIATNITSVAGVCVFTETNSQDKIRFYRVKVSE
ncbi:MAG: chitobiase/beta-hexosaminidase C-terminal domain-containing protein [Verrucomicrobiae bacterium]|nr:chitobiase/beta-hexosaminidase C-terminal domain-containing protein [Verrucomicrobiae bacterium]